MVDSHHVISHVKERSGCKFVLHDLRRCFASKAVQSGISYHVVKKLLNHIAAPDATQAYIVIGIEHLREPMQRITNQLLALMMPPERLLPVAGQNYSGKTFSLAGIFGNILHTEASADEPFARHMTPSTLPLLLSAFQAPQGEFIQFVIID